MEKKYTCPKCGSEKTTKEKIMGADTMDRICQDCGFVDYKTEFQKKCALKNTKQ